MTNKLTFVDPNDEIQGIVYPEQVDLSDLIERALAANQVPVAGFTRLLQKGRADIEVWQPPPFFAQVGHYWSFAEDPVTPGVSDAWQNTTQVGNIGAWMHFRFTSSTSLQGEGVKPPQGTIHKVNAYNESHARERAVRHLIVYRPILPQVNIFPIGVYAVVRKTAVTKKLLLPNVVAGNIVSTHVYWRHRPLAPPAYPPQPDPPPGPWQEAGGGVKLYTVQQECPDARDGERRLWNVWTFEFAPQIVDRADVVFVMEYQHDPAPPQR